METKVNLKPVEIKKNEPDKLDWYDEVNLELGFVNAVLDALYIIGNHSGDTVPKRGTVSCLASEAIDRTDNIRKLIEADYEERLKPQVGGNEDK